MNIPLESLRDRLSREFDDEVLGPSGASIYDLDSGRSLFEHNHQGSFVMASAVKLFTFGAMLEAFGPEGTLTTRVAATGNVGPDGVLDGDLYLVGGGDPTVGRPRHVRRRYQGTGTTIDTIAERVRQAGIVGVRGAVVADGSWFDDQRDPTGRLGALACNRELTDEPALHAATQFTSALNGRDVVVERAPRSGVLPPTARLIARVESPPMGSIAAHGNKHSDNFVAEMLTKALAATKGEQGTTDDGIQHIMDFAARHEADIDLVNGSGLTCRNRCSPNAVLQYLRGIRDAPFYEPLFASLAVAGRDGTLLERMRNTDAQGNCWAKTGTLRTKNTIRFSTLSGYCRHPQGPMLAFSMMMERGKSSYAMLAAQDRAVNAMVAYSAAHATQTNNRRGMARHSQM